MFTASLRSLDPRSPLTAPYQGLELYLPPSHEPCLSEGHLQVTGRVEPETGGDVQASPWRCAPAVDLDVAPISESSVLQHTCLSISGCKPTDIRLCGAQHPPPKAYSLEQEAENEKDR